MDIIKHPGEVQNATLKDGTVVYRQPHLFVDGDGWNVMVECAPYDNHFVFENPDKRKGSPGYLCTCGSVAVVVPPDPRGLFVCLFDLNTGLHGYHSTSLYNKKDIEKVAGKTLDLGKIRKELI